MKKKFEMPIVDIRCFELENVVTTASDPTRSASYYAEQALNNEEVGGIFNLSIVP